MDEALRYFKAYEIWIYLGLGLLAIWQIRKFALAWEEMRGALFGMERESAQVRLNQAASMLVLFLLMGLAEFSLVTFVVPSVPGANPLPTPTLDLLATATTTLPVMTPGTDLAGTPAPSTEGEYPEGCLPGQVVLISPQNGEQISGEITLIGTADIPNFGFYKYEVARPGETIWLPIQVGQEAKREEELGTWDTSNLLPGVYMLRLIVTDNQGSELPPCSIEVHVVTP